MENKQKTVLYQLKEHIDYEVKLNFLDKKYADRLKWYIDTYFLIMEKEQITKAYNSAIPFHFGEQYYNETYGK